MSSKQIPLASRVQESYRQLSVAATTLNSASDALSKSIADLDAVLKKLGLGITGWVLFAEWKGDERWSDDSVGYAKIGGKWGLAIRSRSGHLALDDPKSEDWPFNEAPRALRVRAVAKIPDLLDQLNKDAVAAAKNISDKAAEVDQLTAAITAVTGQEIQSRGITVGEMMMKMKAEAKR